MPARSTLACVVAISMSAVMGGVMTPQASAAPGDNALAVELNYGGAKGGGFVDKTKRYVTSLDYYGADNRNIRTSYFAADSTLLGRVDDGPSAGPTTKLASQAVARIDVCLYDPVKKRTSGCKSSLTKEPKPKPAPKPKPKPKTPAEPKPPTPNKGSVTMRDAKKKVIGFAWITNDGRSIGVNYVAGGYSRALIGVGTWQDGEEVFSRDNNSSLASQDVNLAGEYPRFPITRLQVCLVDRTTEYRIRCAG